VPVYLERGKPVVVLVRFGAGGGPRNVLVQREDGTRVVRPFRGLRRALQERPAVPNRLLLQHHRLEDS
jgi:acetyl esterase